MTPRATPAATIKCEYCERDMPRLYGAYSGDTWFCADCGNELGGGQVDVGLLTKARADNQRLREALRGLLEEHRAMGDALMALVIRSAQAAQRNDAASRGELAGAWAKANAVVGNVVASTAADEAEAALRKAGE